MHFVGNKFDHDNHNMIFDWGDVGPAASCLTGPTLPDTLWHLMTPYALFTSTAEVPFDWGDVGPAASCLTGPTLPDTLWHIMTLYDTLCPVYFYSWGPVWLRWCWTSCQLFDWSYITWHLMSYYDTLWPVYFYSWGPIWMSWSWTSYQLFDRSYIT